MPQLLSLCSRACESKLLSPHATTTEACEPRTCALQQKKPPQGEVQGQTAEARRTTILQPVEQKTHSQKDRQDEKAEGYVPDKGTR